MTVSSTVSRLQQPIFHLLKRTFSTLPSQNANRESLRQRYTPLVSKVLSTTTVVGALGGAGYGASVAIKELAQENPLDHSIKKIAGEALCISAATAIGGAAGGAAGFCAPFAFTILIPGAVVATAIHLTHPQGKSTPSKKGDH